MGQQGNLLTADFFENVGGLNTSDSPFKVQDSQATGGKNFEYTLTGGFRKCKGATKINSSADAALKTLGVGQHFTYANAKTQIRAAGRKIQHFNVSNGTFTNLTEDTAAAGSDILGVASTQPVVMAQFNSASNNLLFAAGGGMTIPYAVYSSTKVTKNGADPATGAIGTSVAAGTSTFASTGTYYYAVALRKASTLAISNAALDASAAVAATTDAVTINLATLTGLDQTKYDQIWIYRSAVNGVSAFTTGDIIAKLASSATSYVDTGTSLAGLAGTTVPRAGNASLDNSVLGANTYNVMTLWKRRLVVASGSTLYASDTNKPESWPTTQSLTIPSGGPITGLAILSFTTPTSQTIDELLCVFKERELWVVTGTDLASTGALKFIDNVGCPNQPLIVSANGYLGWIDYRGIYLWSGSDKPIYISKTIEDRFQGSDSVVDRSKLNLGFGVFARERNEIVWICSSQVDGENVYRIRLDLRLTIPSINGGLGQKMMESVLITDVMPRAYYAGASLVPDSGGVEILLVGDSAGYMYKLFDAFDDAGSAIDFQYESKFFDLGTPGVAKRYHKVIAWCQASSDAMLSLDYWTQYNSGANDSSSVQGQISNQVLDAFWDLAYWDAASWDLTYPGFNPVVFNLAATTNNSNEGDCIKLKFRQNEANAPVTIAGFTIVYTIAGLRK